MKKIETVDQYINNHIAFSEALILLREIITTTQLEESIKWSAPVYSLNGKNVLGLAAFKNHFCIWFFNGVFLKDTNNLLVNAQETTKALRQMRFYAIDEIDKKTVLEYVQEAIENQQQGKEIKPQRKSKAVIIPELLAEALQTEKTLNLAFNNLSAAKKREYCEYIETAKRETTKQTRLQKIKPMILQGVGLHDKYKKC